LPQLGFQIPAMQLRRFLTMCAHNQGQLLNLSKLGSSMDLTHPTIRKYIDIFEQTFIVRSLPPFELNIKKRLVKSPKIYLRDSGILHQLLGIKNMEALFGHPVFGASWEGLVIEQILSVLECSAYFFRTATGDEMDLILDFHGKIVCVECKASIAPQVTKGFYRAIDILKPAKTFVVAPIQTEMYHLQEDIIVCAIQEAIQEIQKMI
jgi:predicted AAA+ superfamily ATPase